MLLASKMKATRPVEAKPLVEYMYHFGVPVSVDQILVWEPFIANKLGWDLSNSTAYEFFDQLMVRAPVLENLLEQFHVTLQAMHRGGWSLSYWECKASQATPNPFTQTAVPTVDSPLYPLPF